MPRNFFESAGSGAAIAGGASGFNPFITAGGAIVGGISSLLGKSDKEIRQQQIREYLKRRAVQRDETLKRLSEETGKNIGRVNQYTTGMLKQTQGDLAARSASRGRGADEADFLAAQGQITGQGSEAIQSTQDASERERRRILDQYEQDVLNAEMEGIFTPEEPGLTDVLNSVAPAFLQYGMNQKLLDKTNPNVTATGSTREIPANFTVEQDKVTDINKPDYNFMGEQQNYYPSVPRRRRLPNTFYPSVVR